MEEIVKNEFQFYSKLAKPLVLNLPKSKDRILAAAWITKLRDEASGDEKLRTIYLKLLLFCLQRRRLTGIFADDPANYDMLEALPQDIDLNDFARNLMEQEKAERREIVRLEMMGDMEAFPAFTTDCSPDLTEYVAAQDIPNFGVHAFYAISKQPVNKWQRSEKAIFPKGTKSAVDTSITAAAAATASCVCSPKGTSSAPEVEGEAVVEGEEVASCLQKTDKGSSEKKKRRPKKLGTSPPTHPIGEVRQPTEERPTPTWGTNLLEVREKSDIGRIDEPSDAAKALDEEVSKMFEDEESEDEDSNAREDISSKAEEMMNLIHDFKHGKMSTPKKPSRLSKKQGKDKGDYSLPEGFAENGDQFGQFEDKGRDGLRFEDNPDFDIDALIREAEEDLAADRTIYDEGLEEDEPIVELFEDEFEALQAELNVSRIAEEIRTASPAISSGIPVTTPKPSGSPKRCKAPEKVFANEDDDLLDHRDSPFRPPRPRPPIDKSSKHSKRPAAPTDKDPDLCKVFKKAKQIPNGLDDSFLEHEREFEELDEFERLESQFAGEMGGSQTCGPRSPGISFSPGDADRVRQRAQQQEQLLRTPDPGYDQFAQEFSGANYDLGRESPCNVCSPPGMTDDEEFEMLESMYQEQSPGGAGMHIPDFDYGPHDVGFVDPMFDYCNYEEGMDTSADSSLGLLPPSAFVTPPDYPTQQDQERQRQQVICRARQQEEMLRQGSPQANQIIQEAEWSFGETLYPRLAGQGQLSGDSPPPPPQPIHGPRRRPDDYMTPPPPVYGTPERPDNYLTPYPCDYTENMNLETMETPDFGQLPVETPETCTPCGMGGAPPRFPHHSPSPGPARRPGRPRPPPPIRRPDGHPSQVGGTPSRVPMPRRPKRLFDESTESPCGVCPPSPEDDEFERLERQFQMESGGGPCPSRQPAPSGTPSDAAAVYAKARQQEELLRRSASPPGGQPRRQPAIDTPTRWTAQDRRKVVTPCAKAVSQPTRPPSPVWSTPEGVPGPSRRQTGTTPPVYDEDFSPPPTPPRSPRFAPAKRIPKRGRYPPSDSPRTPTDQRRIPSPCQRQPQRAPQEVGDGTPMRRPPHLTSRRMFDEPGRTPRLPSVEGPVTHSPWTSPCGVCEEDLPFEFEPLIEDESPPAHMPPHVRTLQDDQMYFPKEMLPCRTPEQLPGMGELKKHQFVPDRAHFDISHRTPFGRGPGRQLPRESVRGVQQMEHIPEDVCQPCSVQQRKPKHISIPKSFRSPRISGPPSPRPSPTGADTLGEIWRANVQVPPERYPPPQQGGVCPGSRRPAVPGPDYFDDREQRRAAEQQAQRHLEGIADQSRLMFDYEGGLLDTSPPQEVGVCPGARAVQGPDYWAGVEQRRTADHEAQRHLEGIADQADLMFDYEGGLLDTSPPQEVDRNYYPDVVEASQNLRRTIERLDLPELTPSPPCRPQPTVPAERPRARPTGPSRPPPSRPSRAPPSRPSRPPGPCPGSRVPQARPSAGPQRPIALKETRSSMLRKQKAAEQLEAEWKAQMKKERAAQAAAQKKRLAQEKRRAALEGQRKAEAQAALETSRGLPDGKMRHPDYTPARGTASIVKKSAAKDPCEEERHDAARVRKQLFAGPQPSIPRPTVCGPCEDPAAHLQGPELMQELREHEIDFPGHRQTITIKGRRKRLRRKSKHSFEQMEQIGEEERSPCGPCGGQEDEYQAALRDIGMTQADAAEVFDMGFLEEEEDVQRPGSPNAIHELEAQLRDMDAYQQQQDAFWREMAGDLDDDELRELGMTREEMQGGTPCGTCETPQRAGGRDQTGQLTQQQQQMLAQIEQIEKRADEIAGSRSPGLTEFEMIEQRLMQREQEEREYFERMTHRDGGAPIQCPGMAQGGSPDELMEFEQLEQQFAQEDQGQHRSRRQRGRRCLEDIQRRTMIGEMTADSERIEREFRRAPSPILARTPPCMQGPPQRFDQGLAMSPGQFEQLEFEQLERQIAQQEQRQPASRRQRQQRDFEDIQRRTMIGEMTADAERMEMEFGRSPSPRARTPTRGAGSPCMSYTPPTPDFLNVGMLDALEGYESPEPLSESWSEQFGICGPIDLQMDEVGVQGLLMEQGGFDPYAYPLEEPQSPEMLDYQSPPNLPPCLMSPQRRDDEERRRYIEREDQEIREMFGASPGPPSPGPDDEFYANVQAHHVPQDFRAGRRPRRTLSIKDRIGTKEVRVKLGRRPVAPNLETVQERATEHSSRSRPRSAPQGPRPHSTQRQPSTSRRVCGSNAPCTGGGSSASRTPAEREGARRLVRKTSSIKKIVTKRN